MNLLQQRERNSDDVLKKRFINKVLNEQASEILSAQNQAMRSRGFSTPTFYDKGQNDKNNRVTMDFKLLHRFVDIKTRSTITGKKMKKNYPIYNRIIFGHLPNIINELSYGFTDNVKQQMRQIDDSI